MQLSIIIVNYNVKHFLEQCLCSVQKAIAQAGIATEIFVVDNNSTDGSMDYLPPRFPNVRFISNTTNVGFAKANNQAIRQSKGQYVLPPMHLERGDARGAIAAAPHRLRDTLEVGGQEQFYLEGQISYAIPQDNDGMLVHCSTQHPSEMQHAVAHALKRRSHQVQVVCRRMGGGFGGKETQAGHLAVWAAIAANKLRRPVKLRLDRDDDFLITGRRHCFRYAYEVGYDDEGRVLAADLETLATLGFRGEALPSIAAAHSAGLVRRMSCPTAMLRARRQVAKARPMR